MSTKNTKKWLVSPIIIVMGILVLGNVPGIVAAADVVDTLASFTGSDQDMWNAGVDSIVRTGGGHAWGCYFPGATADSIFVKSSSDLIIVRPKGGTVATTQGTYMYTIFSSDGTATHDKEVNMSAGTMEVTMANYYNTPEIRVLVRDKNGDWYLSTAATKAALGDAETISTVLFSSLAWEQVIGTAGTDLNEMDAGDAVAIDTLDSGSTSPDLSGVSGGGIYFETPADLTDPSGPTEKAGQMLEFAWREASAVDDWWIY